MTVRIALSKNDNTEKPKWTNYNWVSGDVQIILEGLEPQLIQSTDQSKLAKQIGANRWS